MKYEHKWRKPRYIYGTGFFEYRRKKRSLDDYRTTLNGKLLIRIFICIILLLYLIISYYLIFFRLLGRPRKNCEKD